MGFLTFSSSFLVLDYPGAHLLVPCLEGIPATEALNERGRNIFWFGLTYLCSCAQISTVNKAFLSKGSFDGSVDDLQIFTQPS